MLIHIETHRRARQNHDITTIERAIMMMGISPFLREFSAQTIPGTRRSMTFSAGVVVARPDESLEDAIQRADAATYAAKSAGKNCVVAG